MRLIKSLDIILISLGCGTIWQILNPPPFRDPPYIPNEDLILKQVLNLVLHQIRIAAIDYNYLVCNGVTQIW